LYHLFVTVIGLDFGFFLIQFLLLLLQFLYFVFCSLGRFFKMIIFFSCIDQNLRDFLMFIIKIGSLPEIGFFAILNNFRRIILSKPLNMNYLIPLTNVLSSANFSYLCKIELSKVSLKFVMRFLDLCKGVGCFVGLSLIIISVCSS
jgi:hypothetical protein